MAIITLQFVLSLVLWRLHFGSSADGQQAFDAEPHRARAALLYKFARFVTWPETAFAGDGAPLNICVQGNDRVIDALRESAGSKRVRGRRVDVLDSSDEQGVDPCHILFHGSTEQDELEAQHSVEADRPVLTVGEGPGFIEAGGIVGLSMEEDHFTFSVNSDAARRAGLEISASLLDLATEVIRQEPEEC